MRYFAELCYNGEAYCGWQRQPQSPSVQECLERALTTLLREPIEVVGAGRTDTGVHAAYYVAHFDTHRSLVGDEAHLVYKLNALLPADVRIFTLTEVSDEAHARFNAVAREYRYFVETHKNPFTRRAVWQYYRPLALEPMNQAADRLLHYDDFTSFAKLNSNNHTNICHVTVARWDELSAGSYCFTIRADRFLRNMVRAIVGTLVDVGRGRLSVADFQSIVESRDLSQCSGGAPATGLYLWDIVYPTSLFQRSKESFNRLFY
jgi:tRNA pseudouridine38-40 synthase